jgi:hypothetical protein
VWSNRLVAFLVAAAAVMVLFPAYLDNQCRRENAMKNCLPLGMTLDSKLCDSGFMTDGRTLDRFPVITARESCWNSVPVGTVGCFVTALGEKSTSFECLGTAIVLAIGRKGERRASTVCGRLMNGTTSWKCSRLAARTRS